METKRLLCTNRRNGPLNEIEVVHCGLKSLYRHTFPSSVYALSASPNFDIMEIYFIIRYHFTSRERMSNINRLYASLKRDFWHDKLAERNEWQWKWYLRSLFAEDVRLRSLKHQHVLPIPQWERDGQPLRKLSSSVRVAIRRSTNVQRESGK